jgi:hypothetical protein
MTTPQFLEPKKTAKQTSATRNRTVHVGLYDTFASPESEHQSEQNPLSFYALPSIERLALDQGVPPTTQFEDLLGKSWPENQSVEDFFEARRRWRRERRDLDA